MGRVHRAQLRIEHQFHGHGDDDSWLGLMWAYRGIPLVSDGFKTSNPADQLSLLGTSHEESSSIHSEDFDTSGCLGEDGDLGHP